VFGRAAPCTRGSAGRWPATSTTTATVTAKACTPWDGGEGTDGGGRCKYVHVSSVAPSMALTPPPSVPSPPPTISRGCWRVSIPATGGCRPWSTHRSTPCVDALQIQFEIFDSDGDSSTHGVNPTDTGKLSKAGRCRSAGCQPHGPEACLGRVGQDAQPRPCRVRRTAHTSKRLPSLQGRTCGVPALRHRPANPRIARF